MIPNLLGLAAEMNMPAGASKFHTCKVRDLEPEPTYYEDVKFSSSRTFWEEAMTRELDFLKAVTVLPIETL